MASLFSITVALLSGVEYAVLNSGLTGYNGIL
ncbi:hypothetical protein [Coprobacter sp.]